jgi:hypothetical protein
MIAGIFPFPFNLLLLLAGFLGGAALWHVIAGHSGVWERMQLEADNVRRMLIKQMSFTVIAMLLLITLSWILGGFLATLLRGLASLAEIIFWGYLGALVLTSMRKSRAG